MKETDDAARNPLVLVVDDSASIRSSTQRLLRSFGFRSEAFASAQEFLASPLLQECGCLILDVRMPRMDGLELQRQLAEAHSHLPIIFFTAHGNREEQERAMRAGAIAFLHKPVVAEKLLGAVQGALQDRQRDVEGGEQT
ncbi:MAG TPA: response regulator [Candidatus Methylacidiphilales bacterium]